MKNEVKTFAFWGGADLSPELYGEPNLGSHVNKRQDDADSQMYLDALSAVKDGPVVCVGICRGCQWLYVMSGGKLVQHYKDQHTTLHGVDQYTWLVTSTHHQSCKPPPPKGLSITLTHNGIVEAYEGMNVDGIYCVGFQFHPEMMPPDCEAVKWANERIKLSGSDFRI